ncbi:hypothetical protein EV192_101235 [Actinocrispum wychmicini]|uniref:Uncharacterized protein n=1 Tax=Actinocrispum wychmicini TaxID=1213861 RepID=A0A4R2K3V2_9PSEU|nr:hypothetical protein EV192_101235 [Actinocrispum wychmicini]
MDDVLLEIPTLQRTCDEEVAALALHEFAGAIEYVRCA